MQIGEIWYESNKMKDDFRNVLFKWTGAEKLDRGEKSLLKKYPALKHLRLVGISTKRHTTRFFILM